MAANEPGQPDASPSLISHDLPVPASALAIGAHPDDVEFGCGATLAKWAAAGCTVHHLVLTDGSKGTWNVDADTAALVATRQHEQREAARRLAGPNAGEVVFLGQVDGELDSTLALRSEVARVVRAERLGGGHGDLGGLDELCLGVEVDLPGGAGARHGGVARGGQHQDRGGRLVHFLAQRGVGEPGGQRRCHRSDDEPPGAADDDAVIGERAGGRGPQREGLSRSLDLV